MDPGEKAALNSILIRTLNKLGLSELKRFRHRLRDENERHHQDDKEIPWTTLENADAVTTVDLIVDVYDSESGDVVVSMLQQISQNNLAKTLQRDLDRGAKDGKTTTAGSEKGKEDIQRGSVVGNEGNAATADSGMGEGQRFFSKHKKDLEARLGVLGPILAELEYCEVLSTQEREEVESKATKSQQNRALLVMLHSKGGSAQEEFYKILKEADKYLVKGLMEEGKVQ